MFLGFYPPGKGGRVGGEEVPAAHSDAAKEGADRPAGFPETTVSPAQRAAQRGASEFCHIMFQQIYECLLFHDSTCNQFILTGKYNAAQTASRAKRCCYSSQGTERESVNAKAGETGVVGASEGVPAAAAG